MLGRKKKLKAKKKFPHVELKTKSDEVRKCTAAKEDAKRGRGRGRGKGKKAKAIVYVNAKQTCRVS